MAGRRLGQDATPQTPNPKHLTRNRAVPSSTRSESSRRLLKPVSSMLRTRCKTHTQHTHAHTRAHTHTMRAHACTDTQYLRVHTRGLRLVARLGDLCPKPLASFRCSLVLRLPRAPMLPRASPPSCFTAASHPTSGLVPWPNVEVGSGRLVWRGGAGRGRGCRRNSLEAVVVAGIGEDERGRYDSMFQQDHQCPTRPSVSNKTIKTDGLVDGVMVLSRHGITSDQSCGTLMILLNRCDSMSPQDHLNKTISLVGH